MNTPTCSPKFAPKDDAISFGPVRGEPWRYLTLRIREALASRDFYMASSDDLDVLWSEEKIDATERRRRITFFAAQHHWKVDARADGRAARFHCARSAFSPGEHLSRNHE